MSLKQKAVMRLILVRHGQTAYNAKGILQGEGPIPLDDIGREQARRLATRLASEPITQAYISPLLRAKETGEIILSARNVPVEYNSLLVERRVGSFAGQPAECLRNAREEAGVSAEEYRPPGGGESHADVEVRVMQFLATIPRDQKHILIVTHGNFLRVFLEYLGLFNKESAHPRNTSVTIVEWDGERAEMILYNSVNHLDTQ